jgi:hypothetical protein
VAILRRRVNADTTRFPGSPVNTMTSGGGSDAAARCEDTMFDVLFIVVTLLSFLALAAFVYTCERI